MPVHIKAEKSDIAPFVLLPGDPDRAAYIAETYFENPREYTSYRRMCGFTGTYEGKPVSVQTTGMGTPSAAIITEELIMLGARHLVRVGTCGGLNPALSLGDLVIATTAWGSREIVSEIAGFDHFCPEADFAFCNTMKSMSDKLGIPAHFGPINSVNLFYMDAEKYYRDFIKMGCMALEMEAAAIFSLCAKHRVKTNCLLAVSDVFDQETLIPTRDSEEKILKTVDKMIRVALDSYVSVS